MSAVGLRPKRSLYWGFPFYSPLARILQNHTGAGTGRFGAPTKAIGALLYLLYFANSRNRGDILLVLAEA